MDFTHLTAEMINTYSALEGAKTLEFLKQQSKHAMRENEALQDEVNALRRENMRIRLEEKELEELRELARAVIHQLLMEFTMRLLI